MEENVKASFKQLRELFEDNTKAMQKIVERCSRPRNSRRETLEIEDSSLGSGSRSRSGSTSRSKSRSRSRSDSRSRSRSLDVSEGYDDYRNFASEGAEISSKVQDNDKQRTEVVTITAVEINKMTRVEIAQELEDVDKVEKNILENQHDMKTRHTKEYEDLVKRQADEVDSLDKQMVKNKRKRLDLEKAMQSRLKLPRAPQTPECPVCFEEMKPPTHIFSCHNGPLICGVCRSKVIDDMCTSCRTVKYMGRATAVEQMLNDMFSAYNV